MLASLVMRILELAQESPVPQGWSQWLTAGGVTGTLAGVLYLIAGNGKLRLEREVLDLQARLVSQQALTDLANERARFAEKAAEHIIGAGVDVGDLVKALKNFDSGTS